MHRVGDEVLAPWHDDGFLYPAIVVALESGEAELAFLDGDRGRASIATLRTGRIGPGLAVQGNWRGGGLYYDGVITRRMGSAVHVAYADGDEDWTTVGQCRVRGAVLDALPGDVRSCTYCGAAMAEADLRCDGCGAPRPQVR